MDTSTYYTWEGILIMLKNIAKPSEGAMIWTAVKSLARRGKKKCLLCFRVAFSITGTKVKSSVFSPAAMKPQFVFYIANPSNSFSKK